MRGAVVVRQVKIATLNSHVSTADSVRTAQELMSGYIFDINNTMIRSAQNLDCAYNALELYITTPH